MKQITPAEKKLNKMLSTLAWIFVAIGLGVLIWFYGFSSTHVHTNNAQVRQYITPVSSKVSGFIEEVRFEENHYVKKGDTLVVIDNREFLNQMDIASANLESTAQAVNTFESAVNTKASDIAIVNAKIEAAKIEVWRAEQDFTRFKNLFVQQAATQQQFEGVEAHYKQAMANLKALEQQKVAAGISTSAERTKVAPAKTQVLERKAQLEKAKLNLSYTYVLAPYNGYVGVKNIQKGQLIKEGQALVQVVSEEKWIVANFKETQLGEMDIEKPIEIVADAFPKIKFIGKIESLSPAAGSEFALIKPDNATGNFVKIEQRFPIKIILEPQENLDILRSGMNVEVSAVKLK